MMNKDIVYKSIKTVVDDYINPVNNRDQFGNQKNVKYFDDYMKQTPPPKFSKILYDNYHNEKTLQFFKYMEQEIGLIAPDTREKYKLSQMPLPEFLQKITDIYDTQMNVAKTTVMKIQKKLNKSYNPATVAKIADILGIEQNKK